MPTTLTLSAQGVLDELSAHAEELRAMSVVQLGLFGSGVRDDLTPESDLDFLVDMSDKSFDSYFRVYHFLEDLFGRRIDLVMLGALRPAYAPFILSEARYVEGL